MTYSEFRKKNEDKFNAFDFIFFAFSNEQFDKGMKKIGLTPEDTDKIYSIGAGGYIAKDKSEEFKKYFEDKEKEFQELMKDRDFAYSAFLYELTNHEYCITYDTSEALNALGITNEELEANDNFLLKILQEAKKEAAVVY